MIALSNVITRKVIWKPVGQRRGVSCLSDTDQQRPSHWLIIMNTKLTLAETKSYMSTALPSTVPFVLENFLRSKRLIQRAAQVEVSLEVGSISLPRKIIKHLWVVYNCFYSSVEMQRGLYIRLVQHCGARFSPGKGRGGSAKPSGEAAERSCLTLLRVLRAFILCRISIF